MRLHRQNLLFQQQVLEEQIQRRQRPLASQPQLQ